MNPVEGQLDWNTKYRPHTSGEILGNSEVRESFLNWIKGWESATKKVALLWGPPGVGKTLTVEAVSKELGYHLIELNASDERTREILLERLRAAVTSNTLFGQKNLILLDEVDGIYERTDTGAVEAIMDIVGMAKCPIVMTANDPWKSSLANLRRKAEIFKLDKIPTNSVAQRLREIADAEEILHQSGALENLATRSKGDVRAAIQDLESLSNKVGVITDESIGSLLVERIRDENVFEAIRKCWYAHNLVQAISALRNIEVDYFELSDWIFGNCLSLYSSREELSEGLNLLAQADYLGKRIRAKQEWKLLPYYIELLALAIWLPSKDKGRRLELRRPPRVSEKWIRIGRLKARNKMASSISKILHERRDTTISQILPVINIMGETERVLLELETESGGESAKFVTTESPAKGSRRGRASRKR